MTRAIRAVLFEPVPAWPLAAFRIAFSTVLLLELLHFVSRWDLVLVAHPLRETLPPGTVAALIAWAIALVAVLLGVLTPVAAAVNHHFVCAFFRPDATFSYHADMLYVPASLLLVFVPCYRCWSVDRVLLKRLLRLDVAGRPVPRVYQHVLVFWVMGFMYFDSTVYKLHSPFWVHGLGFWLPASFPSFTVFSWNSLLNCQWLVRAAGHVTLVFELVFIFVFWSRRLRPLLIGLGLALHIGIAVVFPIPLFGLLMVALYAAMLPDPALARLAPAVVRALERRGLTPAPVAAAPFFRFDVGLGGLLLAAAALAALVQSTITFD